MHSDHRRRNIAFETKIKAQSRSTAFYKFQFSGQCPLTLRDVLAGNNRYTIGPTRFVPAVQISVYRSVGIGNMSHLRCDSGRRPQTLPPGGSCQESALRNRFLTEEECGKKTNCIVDVSGLGSGNAFRGLCRIPHVRLPPAFLFRPRCRSATFPPGEGMRRTAALSARRADTFKFTTAR